MKKIFKLDGKGAPGRHIASIAVDARHISGIDDTLDGSRRSRRSFDKKSMPLICAALTLYSVGHGIRVLCDRIKYRSL
jgi:hypothetical protein